MPKFFIDRPIFAWVLSLLIMMAGILAITHLPVAQYPSVAPPSIAINANYAGASAETVQDTVTSVIEQQMNGIDNLLYMSSSSSASGQSSVTLYFDSGTDPDIAQVQVQNKLQLAIPSLPQTVQQQGITVLKSTRNFLMFFTLSSTNNDVSDIALGNYISSSVLDPIRRVTGVGEADLFGTAIRHAHLAESEPARKLQSRRQRRHQRDSGAKRAGPGGTTRRAPVGEGPGNQHHLARPEHADHGQAIRGHSAAGESGRFAGVFARRGPGGAGRRDLCRAGAGGRAARRRRGHPAGALGQRRRHRQCRPRQGRGAFQILPARACTWIFPTTAPNSSRSPSRK